MVCGPSGTGKTFLLEALGQQAVEHGPLATATVDRLLHHAHICQTTGDSVRLTQALAGKGVRPLI